MNAGAPFSIQALFLTMTKIKDLQYMYNDLVYMIQNLHTSSG